MNLRPSPPPLVATERSERRVDDAEPHTIETAFVSSLQLGFRIVGIGRVTQERSTPALLSPDEIEGLGAAARGTPPLRKSNDGLLNARILGHSTIAGASHPSWERPEGAE